MGALTAVSFVLHVQVALSGKEQASYQLTQCGQLRRDVDAGHEQIVALLGFVDVDVASGHDMLRSSGSGLARLICVTAVGRSWSGGCTFTPILGATLAGWQVPLDDRRPRERLNVSMHMPGDVNERACRRR